MKKFFERFMNYLHGAERAKDFSEWLIEKLSAFIRNVKALFSLTKLFEQNENLQQQLRNIEAQNESSKSEVIKAIKTLSKDISNDSKKSQEQINAEIQKLGKNIADELAVLDESTRMLLVASVLDNWERAGK